VGYVVGPHLVGSTIFTEKEKKGLKNQGFSQPTKKGKPQEPGAQNREIPRRPSDLGHLKRKRKNLSKTLKGKKKDRISKEREKKIGNL